MSIDTEIQSEIAPPQVLVDRPSELGTDPLAPAIEQIAKQATVITVAGETGEQVSRQEPLAGIIYLHTETRSAPHERLTRLREITGEIPIIVVAVDGSEQLASDVLAAGATDYVPAQTISDEPERLLKRLEETPNSTLASTVQCWTVFERLSQPVVKVRFNEDHQPIVRRVNSAFEDQFGYVETTLRGESLDAYIVPEESTEKAHRINRQVGTEQTVDPRVVTRQTTDGTTTFLLQTTACDRSHTAVAIYTALTDDHEHQQRLEQLQRRYQTYLKNTLDIVTIVQPDGTIAYQSPAIERVLGYTQEELLDMSAFELIRPDDRERVIETFQTAIETNEETTERAAFRFQHADGSWVWLETLASTRRLPDGYLAVSRDITARKRREQQLQHERDRLEDFASSVAHNFRNPLNVAMGSLRQAREQDTAHHLETTHQALDRIDQLVDELLTLARQGDPIAETQTTSLDEIAQSAWQHVTTTDVTLNVQTTCRVQADPSRLQSLFAALFDNAVTHNDDVSTVTVGTLPAEGVFYVADNGQGIPQSQRQRVFKSGYTTSEQGTGFGLAIVKQIANAHGWTVAVTDSAAGGARFEFTDVDMLANQRTAQWPPS